MACPKTHFLVELINEYCWQMIISDIWLVWNFCTSTLMNLWHTQYLFRCAPTTESHRCVCELILQGSVKYEQNNQLSCQRRDYLNDGTQRVVLMASKVSLSSPMRSLGWRAEYKGNCPSRVLKFIPDRGPRLMRPMCLKSQERIVPIHSFSKTVVRTKNSIFLVSAQLHLRTPPPLSAFKI